MRRGDVDGPIPGVKGVRQCARGKIGPHDMICEKGNKGWMPSERFIESRPAKAVVPAPSALPDPEPTTIIEAEPVVTPKPIVPANVLICTRCKTWGWGTVESAMV